MTDETDQPTDQPIDERPVLRAGAATDVGRVRSVNQDDLLVADGFFAVADGMGGHQGGEVASELAVASLAESPHVSSMLELTDGIKAANRVIIEQAGADADLAGMGTTVCVLAVLDGFAGARLALANVGDSRVYVLREGNLAQLTLDHSLVAELLREGRITEEEAEHHPRKNVVTRALGVSDAVDIDTWELPLVVGERFLLCSDGLFNEVTDNQIEGVLRRLADPDEAAAELVRLANDGGGRDNITVVVVDVVDAGSDAATAASVAADQADARGAGDASLDPEPATDGREARPPFFTWRTALFAAALVGVLIAVVWVVGLVARGTYFVGVDEQDRVVVYRGQPNGVLWFDPTVEEVTDLSIDDVPVEQRADLADGVEYGSLDSALDYVANLARAGLPADDEPPASRAGPTTTS
ncbi:MAG: Stp1/IreP family PP2C-type Ser/Thr phosphatase [Acidimicrobiia bacterium]|nr:Stp1/IreP family PP2C-type Ser/Thr phosphatase [Acidimicrobiia bacterium]